MRQLLRSIVVLWPALLSAQGDVLGAFYDSLRTNGPFVGALVVLEGTALTARTDATGKFRFPVVPPGRYRVRVAAPWLDSLSLAPVSAEVEVRDLRSATARLATPSLRTYHRALCGVEFTTGQGVLRGEVRDVDGAPHAGVPVGAIWSVATIEGAAIVTSIAVALDSSDASGMFTLCGVPRRDAFFVRAGDELVRTADLTIALNGDPGARYDLVVGDGAHTARVAGRITTMRGSALRAAVVAVPGDPPVGARVDASGRFVLAGLPRRTTQLLVRAVGFTPRFVSLDLGASEIELPDIALDPVVLVAVSTAAVRRTVDSLGFRDREQLGAGVFVDDAALASGRRINADTLALYSGAVRSTGGPWPQIQLVRNGARCFPRYYVDAVDFGVAIDGEEEAAWLRAARRFEVHATASTPQQFTDLNGCGVVLIWTQ